MASSCAKCLMTITKSLKCAECQRVAYCSKTCQTEDWANHNEQCKRICKRKNEILVKYAATAPKCGMCEKCINKRKAHWCAKCECVMYCSTSCLETHLGAGHEKACLYFMKMANKVDPDEDYEDSASSSEHITFDIGVNASETSKLADVGSMNSTVSKNASQINDMNSQTPEESLLKKRNTTRLADHNGRKGQTDLEECFSEKSTTSVNPITDNTGFLPGQFYDIEAEHICAKCNKISNGKSRCSQCEKVSYCSRQCRSLDSQKHSDACQKIEQSRRSTDSLVGEEDIFYMLGDYFFQPNREVLNLLSKCFTLFNCTSPRYRALRIFYKVQFVVLLFLLLVLLILFVLVFIRLM